jgi:hypothetical protein
MVTLACYHHHFVSFGRQKNLPFLITCQRIFYQVDRMGSDPYFTAEKPLKHRIKAFPGGRL